MVSLNVQDIMPPESFTLPYPVRRFSVAEYEAMARAEILTEDDKVELLEGWIVPKALKYPLHETVIVLLYHALAARIPVHFHIRVHSVITTNDSCPEPDLMIVRGKPLDYCDRFPQPQDVPLVIEVSESSLERDRTKRRIYARAGIAQYWIVNLKDLCVEVYHDPVGLDDAHYQTGVEYSLADTIEMVLHDGTRISLPVSEFLTPLDADSH